MNITIVMPAGAAARSGNQHTAQRWARFLRADGHRVAVRDDLEDRRCDLLIALHARKSHDAITAFRQRHPARPLIVALTGTDLYRDIRSHAIARESLALATRLIVLQEAGRAELAAPLRSKTRVVYQSAAVMRRAQPVTSRFRIAVVGHLRDEKDPFRAVEALQLLPQRRDIEIVQAGAALSPAMRRQALAWMRADPRYRWLDSLPHAQTLRWLASSQVMVLSSLMEGGANVICEAARIGVPVLASRISGNLGMLGRDYPGYFAVGDSKGLAALIERTADDAGFLRRLQAGTRARRARFAPAAERRALCAVVNELI